MSNETPPNNAGWLSTILNEIDLPKLIAGEAGKSLSRLVGSVLDVPEAWIADKAQKIKDQTRAKSLISDALANKIADQATSDPEIVSRTMTRWLGEETRKQENREAVARVAIENLSTEGESKSTVPVEDDWLDVLISYAEKANSENMRDLWGRVMAGEIRKPGSYSLSTLRFMSELDQETAKVVEDVFSRVHSGFMLFFLDEYRRGVWLSKNTLLESKGLLFGAEGNRTNKMTIQSNGNLFLTHRKHAIVLNGSANTELNLPSITLSNMGREVLTLLKLEDDIEYAKVLSKKIDKENLNSVTWTEYEKVENRLFAIGSPVKLWEKPASPENGATH